MRSGTLGKVFNEIKNPYAWPEVELSSEGVTAFFTSQLGIAPQQFFRLVDTWLEEDHGAGDVNVWAHPNPSREVEGYVISKSSLVLCGLWAMVATFFRCGAKVFASSCQEGAKLNAGEVVLAVRGPLSSLLLAERVALNTCARLSGVSTYTLAQVEALQRANPQAPQLLETRKTTPGWRILEKYATRVGGARNHRHGLDSGVMLKENHLRSSLLDAPSTIDYIKKRAPILLQTEVEVSTLDEFLVALNSLAPVIMLDNFSFEDVLNAVEIRNQKAPQTRIEVSGNLDRWPKEKLAHCGADYASMGSLIYKAPWADLSLQIFNRDADI